MVDLTQMDSTTTEVDSTMVATTTTEVDSTTVASITEVTTTNPLEAEVAEVVSTTVAVDTKDQLQVSVNGKMVNTNQLLVMRN